MRETDQVAGNGLGCEGLPQFVTVLCEHRWCDIGKPHIADMLTPPSQLWALHSNGAGAFLGQDGLAVAVDEVGHSVPFRFSAGEMPAFPQIGFGALCPAFGIGEPLEAGGLGRVALQSDLDVKCGGAIGVGAFPDACHEYALCVQLCHECAIDLL
jgi:NAD-dependent dihydropyrimidine dehydrogenase PreA subunit